MVVLEEVQVLQLELILLELAAVVVVGMALVVVVAAAAVRELVDLLHQAVVVVAKVAVASRC